LRRFGGNTAFFSPFWHPDATQPQWTCDRSEFFNLA
jgi:hypothetical protein